MCNTSSEQVQSDNLLASVFIAWLYFRKWGDFGKHENGFDENTEMLMRRGVWLPAVKCIHGANTWALNLLQLRCEVFGSKVWYQFSLPLFYRTIKFIKFKCLDNGWKVLPSNLKDINNLMVYLEALILPQNNFKLSRVWSMLSFSTLLNMDAMEFHGEFCLHLEGFKIESWSWVGRIYSLNISLLGNHPFWWKLCVQVKVPFLPW